MSREWYLLYTQPKKEALVADQLSARDLNVFYPTLHIKRGYNRGFREEPLFPHYLFVEIDLESQMATGLRWLPGVRTLVHFGERPAFVPRHIVECLQDKLAYMQKTVSKAELLFTPGQTVKVNKGPFAGLDAVFQKGLKGTERVQVLLEVLGRQSRVELDVRDIKVA